MANEMTQEEIQLMEQILKELQKLSNTQQQIISLIKTPNEYDK